MELARHVEAASLGETEDRTLRGRIVTSERERPDRLRDAVRDDKAAVVAIHRKRRAGRQAAVLAEVHAREGDLRRPAVRVRRVHQQGRQVLATLRDVKAAVRPAVVQRLDPLLPDNGTGFRSVVEICVKPSRPHLDARHRRGELRGVTTIVAVPPDAAVDDQVQLAARRILKIVHLEDAAVQDAHGRNPVLVVVNGFATEQGTRPGDDHFVCRVGAAGVRRDSKVCAIGTQVTAIADDDRGIRALMVGHRDSVAVHLRTRTGDLQPRRVPLGGLVAPHHAEIARLVARRPHQERRAVHDAQGRFQARGGVGLPAVRRADVDAPRRARDAVADDEDARRLLAVDRGSLSDGEVDVDAGEDVRHGLVVGRVDHHRAVSDGERRVALRGRAVRREVRIGVVDGAG